jgi:hypothetical protein
MPSVSTPVMAYLASINAGAALAQTGTLTFAVNIPNAWQILLPVIFKAPNTANISAGPLIYVFRSTDGGTTYDTVPLQSIGLLRPTAALQQQFSMKLEAGNYLVCAVAGGGVAATWTAQVLTSQILTAIVQN